MQKFLRNLLAPLRLNMRGLLHNDIALLGIGRMVIAVKAVGARLIEGIGPGVFAGDLAAVEQPVDIGGRVIGIVFIGKGNRSAGFHYQLLRHK